MKKTLQILSFIPLFFALTNCQKGDKGPAGPAGPAGNANVTATNYIASTWTNGSSFWYIDLDVPALTSSAQSGAAVQVFFSTNNGTDWTAVPYTAVATTNYFMGFVTQQGAVEVQWTYNGVGNGSSPTSFFGTTLKFKVVVIPASKIKPGLNTQNFYELKTEYNLNEQ